MYRRNNIRCKTFSVAIKKELIKISKDGNESDESISYKKKIIDCSRFMASSLSNLVDNLAEELHKIKCKNYKYFSENKCVKDNLIIHKCLSCSKCYS